MWNNKRAVIAAIYVFAGVPLIAVVGFGGWLYADLYRTSEQFESKIEQGSGSDIPLNPTEFSRFIVLDPSQDASAKFVQVAEEWEKLPESERSFIISQIRLFATSVEGNDPRQAQAYVKSQPYVQKLRDAAKLKDSQFSRDWTGDTELLEPHYHTTIQFGRLLTATALAEARLNKPEAAFATLNTLRKLSAHYSRDGGLDALVTHANLETQSISTAQEILFRFGKNSRALALYRSFIADRTTKPDLVRNMEGEAMRTIFVLSQADSFEDRMFSGTRLSLKNQTFQRAAAIRMSEFWTDAIAAAKSSSPDAVAMRDSYLETVSEFSRQRSPSRVIPSAIAEWNTERLNIAASLEVRYALAATVGDLLKNNQQTNDFPKSLAEINSREVDPYTRDPFKYQKTETGFVLYSTGSDRIDDGGEFADSGIATDIVVSFVDGKFMIAGV